MPGGASCSDNFEKLFRSGGPSGSSKPSQAFRQHVAHSLKSRLATELPQLNLVYKLSKVTGLFGSASSLKH